MWHADSRYPSRAYYALIIFLALLLLTTRTNGQLSPPSPLNANQDNVAAASTLYSYVSADQLWSSRGAWYNIVAWAARTSNCVQNASSVTCMACSQELPASAIANGVAPIAVANTLWFTPERSATCGMCLKVCMPNNTDTSSACGDPNVSPSCPGVGTQPYVTSVSDPLNYGARVQYDPMKQLPYFVAMVIEWLDRNFTDRYALSYPTQKTEGVESFGTWPVEYEGIPCPVGTSNLEFQFLNTSAPFPNAQPTDQTAWTESGSSTGLPAGVGNTLCNNLAGNPCGSFLQNQNAFYFMKLQITNQRIPISSVEVLLTGYGDTIWHSLKRSGDGYWEPESLPYTLDASKPIDVRVTCSDDSPPKIEPGLIPYSMLCQYQDPLCARKAGSIQC